MTTKSTDGTALTSTLEALGQELALLRERVTALETTLAVKPAPAPAQAAQPVQSPQEEISEEIVMVLSAAIAAFLGKKAPVRQIRLLGSAAWAQQGRVTIQASHNLK